jgi:hypothetical protein
VFFPIGGINFNDSFPYFKLLTVDFADHMCFVKLFPQIVHAQDILCGLVPGHGTTNKHQPKDKQHPGVGKAK